MVYDWENKEDICYKMYIEEKKSLEEIMEYLKESSGFAPRYGTVSQYPSARVLPLSNLLLTSIIVRELFKPNLNVGIFHPNKTPRTRIQPSYNASRNYGTRIPHSGRCLQFSTMKAFQLRSASSCECVRKIVGFCGSPMA